MFGVQAGVPACPVQQHWTAPVHCHCCHQNIPKAQQSGVISSTALQRAVKAKTSPYRAPDPQKGSFDPARATGLVGDDGTESLLVTADPRAPAQALSPIQISNPSTFLSRRCCWSWMVLNSPCFTCLTPAQTPAHVAARSSGTSQGSRHLCPCQAGPAISPPPA